MVVQIIIIVICKTIQFFRYRKWLIDDYSTAVYHFIRSYRNYTQPKKIKTPKIKIVKKHYTKFHNQHQSDIYLGPTDLDSNLLCNMITMPGFDKLTPTAHSSLLTTNAGGKSEISEALSIHLLNKYFQASHFVYEKDIEYWCDYKMVDYICSINDSRIGVSVTRAIGPYLAKHDIFDSDNFTTEEAHRLLDKKLNGLIMARTAVNNNMSFYTAILHIFCHNELIAKIMKQAALERVFTNDDCRFIIMLTVCSDDIIYSSNYDKDFSLT